MRMTNRAAAMTGKRFRGIAIVGGAAALVLASGGIATASTFPGHHGAGFSNQHHHARSVSSWNRVHNTQPGNTPTQTPAPVQGQPGWNRVSNTTGTAGGQGGQAPGAAPTPATTPGLGGQGGPGGPGTGTASTPGLGGQGGQGGPGLTSTSTPGLGGQGGPGGPGLGLTSTSTPGLGGQGGLAPAN